MFKYFLLFLSFFYQTFCFLIRSRLQWLHVITLENHFDILKHCVQTYLYKDIYINNFVKHVCFLVHAQFILKAKN